MELNKFFCIICFTALCCTAESNIPKPAIKLNTPQSQVFVTERVELNCTLEGSSEWRFTWFRDSKEIPADGATLSIPSASTAHAGKYMCRGDDSSRNLTTHDSDEFPIKVNEIPVPSAAVQTPWSAVFTSETVGLNCSMQGSPDPWIYTWYRGGQEVVVQGPGVSDGADGSQFEISSARLDHAGQYTCTGRLKDRPVKSAPSNTLSIEVKARPWATVTLLTGWSEVFSADRLDLKCEVHGSKDTWNYTWFGGSEVSPLSYAAKHPVMSKDVQQSHYSCSGIRSSRPLYSKRSDPFKTTNLLLKRRVLLSISGCLFFGIIAVFIGCIVMRLTRKPVTSEEKPEEPNLFLTRAELQASDVAPCPLAEYISDEELPALTKDEEDKETVCCESTPLPLSFSEGEAETSETNGGLKSFKY